MLGSTSEAAYLPDRQRRLVVESVAAHVSGQLPVLAGAIDMTTARVLDHVASVTAAGADAVVVTAPFYARTHPAEIARHYRVVAVNGRSRSSPTTFPSPSTRSCPRTWSWNWRPTVSWPG